MSRVTIEFVRDLERRIAFLEKRVNNLAELVEGPPPWDQEAEDALLLDPLPEGDY